MNMQNKLAQLFSFISQNPKCSLTKTFTHFAKKWSLSRDSVRNIYYQNYSKVLSDSSFCTKHSIKQANFKKNNPNSFTEAETEWLTSEVQKKMQEGYSLRKACLELADGNVSLMVRYLNKFRTLNRILNTKQAPHKKEKISIFNPTVKEENPNLNPQEDRVEENQNLNNKEEYDVVNNKNSIQELSNQSKIIQMPEKADILSEKDIQSLFLGLIRLVKNNTIKEMNFVLNEKYKEKITEIYTLKYNLSVVKNQLEEEKRIASKLQTELNLLKNNKLEEYGNFMNKLNSNDYGSKNKLN